MTQYLTATLWLIVALAGLGTQLLRFSFVVAFAWFDAVQASVERALELVPAAVLSALVLPAILAPEGAVAVEAPRLVAAFAATVVARYSESVAATIGAGMATLRIPQAI